MRLIKSLSILVVLYLLNLAFSADVNAQGRFGCAWKDKGKYCVIDSKTIKNCKNGYSPIQAICRSHTTPPPCIADKPECTETIQDAKCPTGSTEFTTWARKIGLPFTDSMLCCSNDFLDALRNKNPNISDTDIAKACKADPSVQATPDCGSVYHEWIPGTAHCRLQGPSLHICETLPDEQIDTCFDCIGRPGEKGNKNQMWTALGCISTTPTGFIGWLLSSAISLGGGIAFLLMIFGAFQVIISGGDPEKLNSGKEVLTSAIAGLLMIIFSVVLLKIIGYDILRIPGITLK